MEAWGTVGFEEYIEIDKLKEHFLILCSTEVGREGGRVVWGNGCSRESLGSPGFFLILKNENK